MSLALKPCDGTNQWNLRRLVHPVGYSQMTRQLNAAFGPNQKRVHVGNRLKVCG